MGIAQGQMMRYLDQMRNEGSSLSPFVDWRMTETNPPDVGWRAEVKVILPKVGLKTISFLAYRGSNGWVAVGAQ